MEEQDKLVLPDKSIIPDDKLLESILGDKMSLWLKLMDEVSTRFKDSSGSWNYYKDGQQWLFKMVYKKKTLFWSAMHADTFRVTFYFGDKAEPVLEASELPQIIKDNFKTAKRYGAIRGITQKILNKDDLELVLKLAEIKSKLK